MPNRSFAAILAVVCSFATAAAAASGEDAVSYQINAAHTGSVNFAAGFAPPLVRAWSGTFGNWQSSWPYPLIAKNTVFTVIDDTEVVAIDLATGVQKWSAALDCCWAVGAYDDGRLFYLNNAGKLVALSAKSGRKQWSADLSFQDSIVTPLIAAEGQVFTGAGNAVRAVDEQTGKLQWTRSFGSDLTIPAFGDGGVYAEYECDFLKLAPHNGTTVWEMFQGCIGGGGMPVYSKHRVFFGEGDEEPYVASSIDGHMLGTYPSRSAAPVVFVDPRSGRLRGLTMDVAGGPINCWDAKSNKVLWSFGGDNQLIIMPIVVNGIVFVGSQSGNLYALDPRHGKELWRDNAGGAIQGMNAGQGTLVVVSGDKVVAYRPQ